MTSMPLDPINVNPITETHSGAWITGNFVYQYGNVFKDGNAYALFTQLEQKENQYRCGVQNYSFVISTSTYTCNAANAYGRCWRCPYMYVKADIGQ